MPSQRYAIVGAILIKSVEVLPSTIQNEQEVGVVLVTVTNEQEREHVALLLQINKRLSSSIYCSKYVRG